MREFDRPTGLLDDLREQVWRNYALQLCPLFREDRIQENIGSPGNHNPESSDEPF